MEITETIERVIEKMESEKISLMSEMAACVYQGRPNDLPKVFARMRELERRIILLDGKIEKWGL